MMPKNAVPFLWNTEKILKMHFFMKFSAVFLQEKKHRSAKPAII